MAYAPAVNLTTTPSLAHLATVYYERKGLDTLMRKFQFRQATMPDILPKRSGKTVQFYRYSLLSANTTPASEGAVGAGIPLTTTTITATVSEYADYTTISSLLDETAIDPIAENAADMLGYRGGLTVDTVVRTEFDSNVASVGVNTIGATLTTNDLRKSVMTLEGVDVRPIANEEFLVILHPYVLYDLTADNTAGGFIDVMKFANPQAMISGQAAMSGVAGRIAGCRILKSTNVGTTGSAPNTFYYTYVVGKGAVGAIDLAGVGPAEVQDPEKQKFRINVVKGGPQIADPAGMIGYAVSYRCVFTAQTLDSTTYRYQIIRCDSSIV